MLRNIKNMRIFSKLSLNIIIMLFFVLMISALISGYISSSAIKKETNSSNMIFLNKLSKIIENELYHIDNLLVRFLQSNMNDENIMQEIADNYQRYILYKKINELIQNNPFIDSLYVFFDQEKQTFIQTEKICKLVVTESFFDKELFEHFISGNNFSEIMGTRFLQPNYYGRDSWDHENRNVVSFIKRLPITTIDSKNAAVLNVNADYFMQMIGGNYIPKGSTILILDKNRKVFLSYSKATGSSVTVNSEDMKRISSLLSGIHAKSKSFSTSFNDEKSYLTSYDSANDRTYLFIIPERVIFNTIRTVNITLLILSTILLIIGIIISNFIDKKFFQPVLSILRSLSINQLNNQEIGAEEFITSVKNKGNEFQQIESYIGDIITREKDQKRQLQNYFAYSREKMILALVNGDKQTIKMHENDEILFNKNFKWFNIVLLQFYKDYDNAGKDMSNTAINIYAGNILNILSNIGQVDRIDVGNRKIAFLVCLESNIIASDIASYIWKNVTPEMLSSKCIITVGCLCESMINIGDSFADANRLLQYDSDKMELQILDASSVKNHIHISGIYPEKITSQIIESIKQHNKPGVKSDLKLFFEKLKQYDRGIDRIKKCSIILLISISVDTKENFKGNRLLLFNSILSDLDDMDTVNEIEIWMSRMLDDYVLDGIGRDEGVNNEELVDKVIKYIDKHYMEDVGLNTIADYVYFSPSYLGRIFKEISGFTFTDYIIKTRMEAASKLLINKNVKVTEIMEKVGYISIQSFSRVFRNYFKCSPSEYRKNHAWDVLDSNKTDKQII